MSEPRARFRPSHISEAEWEEMKRIEIERERQLDERARLVQMKMLARGANDGRGFCKYCSVSLRVETIDGVLTTLHDIVECKRPQRCDVCGYEWMPQGTRSESCAKCAERIESEAKKVVADAPIEMKALRRQTRLFGERDDD